MRTINLQNKNSSKVTQHFIQIFYIKPTQEIDEKSLLKAQMILSFKRVRLPEDPEYVKKLI